MIGKRLLVVEDEAIVANSIQKTLEKMGYLVPATASSGEEAVQLTAEKRPDLVLMDIKLPGDMDGVKATEQIHARFDIPVVYLTAYADEETLQRAKITEPFGYVLKPFEARELRSSIEMALYRHEAEKKLRESERRFKAVFETAQDFIFMKDRDLRYTHVNNAVERLFELPPSRLVGQTDDQLFGDEAGSHLREVDSRVLDGEIVKEDYAKSVKGVPRTFHIIRVPMRDRSGEIIGLCGIARDITERKRTEDLAGIQRDLAIGLTDAPGLDSALQLCTEKAIEASGMDSGGVYLVDENSVALRLAYHMGLPPDFVKSVSHYDADSANAKLVMEGRPVYTHHRQLGVPLGGSEKREALRAIAVLPVHHDGRVIGCLHVASHELEEVPLFARDVLEAIAAQIGSAIIRLKTEEELEDANARMQALIHAIPDLIYFKDVQGRNLLVNRAFEELLDRKREHMIGKTDDQILPPDLAEKCRQSDQSVIESCEPLRFEEKTKGMGNETMFFETIKAPVFDDQGRVDGLVGVSRDITERKRAEEERETLDARVQQAQKLESLGTLTGGIAHDFNNLLMGIMGNADMILKDLPGDSPLHQHVVGIKEASQRAADLARQMLAYSGKGKYLVQPMDINEVVEAMESLLQSSVSKKIVLKYGLADSLPATEGDLAQMKQVMMNLVTNASEAIGNETGLITLTTGVMECDKSYLKNAYPGNDLREGTYVYIEVSDTGRGMDKQTLSKIFDPFFTTKFAGRGLGLAAVIGIVRSHNGAVEVRSEPGSGTTFRILLPAVSRTPELVREETTKGEDSEAMGTVLLVDDEETVLNVAEKMLEPFGYRVLTARDGMEAVEVLRENAEKIDAAILDLTMPDMDGREVLTEAQRIKSGVPIILSSGYDEEKALQEFGGLELAGFIQKPYTASDLVAKVKKAMAKTG